MSSRKVAVAYIPVLHKGYVDFVASFSKKGVTELYLISDGILASHKELDYINRKDRIRALPHEMMKQQLSLIAPVPVFSLTTETILQLRDERATLLMPREDINIFLAETYFGGHPIEYENVFLRWNKSNLGEEKEPQTEHVSLSVFEREVLLRMQTEGARSTDWWRQVGAALVRGGEVLAISHNEHLPEEELPNIFGDARSLFKKGVNVNYVTTAHAEASAIAESARLGKTTEGATLFTTDFPCPYCARVIAKAGIKKLYYLKGYAILGGDDFFKEMGIEAIKVDLES